MSWRGRLRRSMPYLLAMAGGFMLAWLIVAFFVFPSGVIPQDITVPNVVGLQYDDAARQLEQSGLVAERGEQQYHTAPRGSVLEQTPEPGSVESAGATVRLIVSAGQRYVSVPGVIGMTREEALTALENAGFRIGEVVERASNEPRGAVIDARPRPGTRAAVPSNVSLVLSAGPRIVVVPDLIGRSLDDAKILLQQVGLAVGEITWASGSAIADAAAVVVAQTPAAGSETPMRTRVNITAGSRFP